MSAIFSLKKVVRKAHKSQSFLKPCITVPKKSNLVINIFSSSDREYEETGSEGQEAEGDIEEGMGEDNEERIEEEQEREDLDMMESNQRNHIGKNYINTYLYDI